MTRLPPRRLQRASSMSATAQNRLTQKKPINLLRGWPSTTLLPAAAMRTASYAALSDPAVATPALLYGPDHGYPPLREELARWLGRFYGEDEGEDVGADGITVTGGASQSIACVLQSFTDPAYTRAVWMVAPCYFLACPIFADAGFAGRLRAVPEDAEGVDLAVLERGLREVERRAADGDGEGNGTPRYKDPDPQRKIYRHVIYCVPSFANPSGKTMSLARREELVRLAREYDALVICDDVYDMLQWPVLCPPTSDTTTTTTTSTTSTTPTATSTSTTTQSPDPATLTTALLPRLTTLDMRLGPSPHDPPGAHFGHAVSNGSFSKLVGPGVRTGWTHSTAGFATGLSRTGSTRSGGAPSQLTAAALCGMLAAGALDAHIEGALKPAYQRRHGLLVGAAARELAPLGVRVREGSLCGRGDVFGGYFVWMSLPGDEDGDVKRIYPSAKALADRCRRDEELMVGYGGLFEVHGDEEAVRFDRDLRLCFAWEDEADLVEGVARLGRVLRAMLEEGPEGWGDKDGYGGEDDIHQMK